MEPPEFVIRRDGEAGVVVVLLRRVTGAVGEDGIWQAITAPVGPA